jgi:hypothetical protein
MSDTASPLCNRDFHARQIRLGSRCAAVFSRYRPCRTRRRFATRQNVCQNCGVFACARCTRDASAGITTREREILAEEGSRYRARRVQETPCIGACGSAAQGPRRGVHQSTNAASESVGEQGQSDATIATQGSVAERCDVPVTLRQHGLAAAQEPGAVISKASR